MNENKNISSRWLQIAGIIIGIMSLAWGIYANLQRKYQKEADAATILRLTEQAFGLQREINIHKENDALHAKRYDSLVVAQQKDRQASLHHKGIADAYRIQIEQLQTKLHEKVIIDVSDDEHIHMFIQWAKQP